MDKRCQVTNLLNPRSDKMVENCWTKFWRGKHGSRETFGKWTQSCFALMTLAGAATQKAQTRGRAQHRACYRGQDWLGAYGGVLHQLGETQELVQTCASRGGGLRRPEEEAESNPRGSQSRIPDQTASTPGLLNPGTGGGHTGVYNIHPVNYACIAFFYICLNSQFLKRFLRKSFKNCS